MKNALYGIGGAVVGYIVSLFITHSTVISATYNGTMAACQFMN
jgi:hypothetical protein